MSDFALIIIGLLILNYIANVLSEILKKEQEDTNA